jgi:hypothetical protein
MDSKKDKSESSGIFDSLGMSVQYGQVEVGQTYPIYGAITEIKDTTPGQMIIIVNSNIELALTVSELDKVDLLKSRMFEPGIFITTIKTIGDIIKGECSTVVFGKREDNSNLH